MTSAPAAPTAILKGAALLLAALALPLAGCSAASTASSAPATTSASAPSASASPTASASSASASATPSASATSAKPTPTPTKTASGYTMADVKKHADAKSCWSVVNGNVYDLTKWVNRHPGGRARILSMCGKDGTSIYRGEHGKESRPADILAGYKLGKLA